MRPDWIGQELRELAVDRSRAALVVLGVVWGTLSLTVVLAFGDGFDRAMNGAMRAAGEDMMYLWGGATTRPHAGFPAGRSIQLVPEDAEAIARKVPGVRAVSVEFIAYTSGLMREGARTTANVHGVSPSCGGLRQLLPQPGGRFLDEPDEAQRRRVAFLGDAVKERLFGSGPAVGETVEIWGARFTVIGVLRPKLALSNYEGFDREKVWIPAATLQALLGWRFLSYLVVGAASRDDEARIVEGIFRTLGGLHRFDPLDRDSLGLWNGIAEDRQARGIIGGIRILMGIIGLLGLLVALVGVANVLFVLAEERRREIGIQMALGARRAALLAGFLFDALILTIAGGAVGILASAGVLWLYNRLPLGPEARGYLGRGEVSLALALGITALLAVAGALAGWFPARRAAAVDPVEVLREE
jgi:putative ABC transport system permease protein